MASSWYISARAAAREPESFRFGLCGIAPIFLGAWHDFLFDPESFENHSESIDTHHVIYIIMCLQYIYIYSYIHIICYEHSLRFSWNLTIPQLATRTGEFAAGISASASKFAGAPLGWRPLK